MEIRPHRDHQASGAQGRSRAAATLPAQCARAAAGWLAARLVLLATRARAAQLLGMLASMLCATVAFAGPWEARLSQGQVASIVQDVARTRDGYVLQLRREDGTPETSFGQQGSLAFALGPDNDEPAALRVDAWDRLWLVGASLATPDRPEAVVLRFLMPQGRADFAFGAGGRATMSPGNRPARALDAAPLADGGALVAGVVVDANGQERAGWWRIDAAGRVDQRFGLGGLWTDEGSGGTEPIELSIGSDGSAALSLRRSDGAKTSLEAWVLRAGADLPVAGPRIPDLPGATVARRDSRWIWVSVDGAPIDVPSNAGGAPAAADGGAPSAAANPFGASPLEAAAAASAPDADDTEDGSGLLPRIVGWGVLVLGIVGAALAWRGIRRRHKQ